MGRPILGPFVKFSAEAAIIGRLSAGYTTLEVGLLHCVQVVRDDFDAVLKALFRVRGESARIGMGEGFAWHFYDQLGLGTEFQEGIAAMRKCTGIRNQYAHCVWYDDNSGKVPNGPGKHFHCAIPVPGLEVNYRAELYSPVNGG